MMKIVVKSICKSTNFTKKSKSFNRRREKWTFSSNHSCM